MASSQSAEQVLPQPGSPTGRAIQPNTLGFADKALKGAAGFWFLTAVVGQWIFVYYVMMFYGGTALQGNFEAWNDVLVHGFIPGEPVGNFVVFMHMLLAVIITVGGPIQLVPQIRNRFRTFHRWNGRVYILTAFLISIDGIYMIVTRGTIGGLSQHISVSLNGVLIMIFAALALRYAMARDIKTHRRWALRLFLAVSGVWFFRVGLMFWLAVNQGPVGFDPETFTGPFLTFWAFGQYLVPLAVLEVYFRVQDSSSSTARYAMAGGLVVLTLAMALGIFTAFMGMWLPRLG